MERSGHPEAMRMTFTHPTKRLSFLKALRRLIAHPIKRLGE
jgi:hypothetical protein